MFDPQEGTYQRGVDARSLLEKNAGAIYYRAVIIKAAEEAPVTVETPVSKGKEEADEVFIFRYALFFTHLKAAGGHPKEKDSPKAARYRSTDDSGSAR